MATTTTTTSPLREKKRKTEDEVATETPDENGGVTVEGDEELVPLVSMC